MHNPIQVSTTWPGALMEKNLLFPAGMPGPSLFSIRTSILLNRMAQVFARSPILPDAAEYSKYPKGNVVITVRNNSYSFQASNATAGTFFVYVAGAVRTTIVTIPPGSAKTLTFNSVADFGKKAQAIVAIYGNYRWFEAGADVQAGKTVKAPDLGISGDGIQYFGAFHPEWRNDGLEIGYRTGTCTVDRVPVDPPQGEFFYKAMFGGKPPLVPVPGNGVPQPHWRIKLFILKIQQSLPSFS
jgi:hypothetical protein